MADFNKPTVDSEYTQFPTEIRAAISAALSFLDGEHTNIPLKAKRWNTSSKIFEEYNGTQWVPMATEYKLPVDYNSLKNKPTPNSAVDDESDTTFASSAAVKTAYDKGVAAEELANKKWTAKSATEKEPGILPISHKTDGADKNKFASEYAVGEAAKKGLPVGAIVAFPSAVTNPVGFLRADGSTFNTQIFPDLYRTLGNSNKLPDLTRSDVGMTAYFTVDNIPSGWIAFDEIAAQVTEQRYPELYRHLVGKYGSIASVPKVADRFLRNAGDGLSVGQIQEDELKRHAHKVFSSNPSHRSASIEGLKNDNNLLDAGLVTAIDDSEWRDNGWMTPDVNSNFATGGAETRPKSLILKLCIKAINSFDDVVFWIKSHGEVTNAGTLDAGRLAQDIQQLSAKTQQIERQSNQNEKLSLELKNQLSQIKNKEPTSRKIWQGNVTNGSGVLTLSESIINKNLVFYLQPSSGHTLSNNDVNTVSCYIDSTLPDVRRTRFAFTAYWDGGLRNFKIEIVSEKQIKLIDASSFYLKMITASD